MIAFTLSFSDSLLDRDRGDRNVESWGTATLRRLFVWWRVWRGERSLLRWFRSSPCLVQHRYDSSGWQLCWDYLGLWCESSKFETMFPLTRTSVWNDTKKYCILAESLVLVLHGPWKVPPCGAVWKPGLLEPISWSQVAMEEMSPLSRDGSNETLILFLLRREDLGYWQVGIRAIRINGEVCLGSFWSPWHSSMAPSRRQNFTTSEAWGVHRWHLQRRPGYRHLTFGCARSVWQGHRSVRYNARYNWYNSLFVSPCESLRPCPYLPFVSFANMIIWWPVHPLHIDLVGVWAEIADGCGRSIGLPQCRCSAAGDWVVGGQSCMAELCWTLQGWICSMLEDLFWLLWVALIHWLQTANSNDSSCSGPKVITLYPFNYMRRLPLRDGITVGSSEGRDDKDFQMTWLRSCVHIHDVFKNSEVPPDAIFQDSFSKLYNYARWRMFWNVLKRQS